MRYLFFVLMLLRATFCWSQSFPATDYPRDYFRNPLDIPIRLAANFGELRPNHYHMGLDIRTQQRENLPVFAAADGYIARVVIEPGGFGQAIYVRHPNGYTTLYAHLNAFFPALDAYVSAEQYRLESWELSLDIPAGLFPVKKGEQIALSGNRGGSQGPHLHFEIRRTADDTNLNPLLFGMPVADNVAPGILRLAVYDRTVSVYEQAPATYAVHRLGAGAGKRGAAGARGKVAGARGKGAAGAKGKVVATGEAVSGGGAAGGAGSGVSKAVFAVAPAVITLTSPRVSFAISAFDTQTGSANPNGIYQATLFDNDRPVIAFRMNNISYNDTRGINAHIDYRLRAMGGPWLQHLSQLPGYTAPSVYQSAGPGKDGVIDCSDGAVHSIRIEVKDADGNVSNLSYKVQYPFPGTVRSRVAAPGRLFYPGMVDASETDFCSFYTGEKSLYDSVHIEQKLSCYPCAGHSLPNAISATYTIGAPYIPLSEPLLVRIRPNIGWVDSVMSKVVMVCAAGEKRDVRKPDWQGGWGSARFRSFGNFQLVEDKAAPVIMPVGFVDGAVLTKAAKIAISVKDDLGVIAHFRATLDGRWLCFTNDKGLAYIYAFDAHCPAGKHELTVEATDLAGNKAIRTFNFTR